MRSKNKIDSLADKDESLYLFHMSHLNIESSYVFCKNIYIFPSSCLTSGLAVYFCKLTGCLMSDSLTLRSDSSQAGARWAVYSVIHSLVTPPAPLCISLYFCITARCEVCEVYFRSLIFTFYLSCFTSCTFYTLNHFYTEKFIRQSSKKRLLG